jgi:polyisoprenoid-binding protein YceI
MKRTFLSFILAASYAPAATYEIDGAHSAAQFTVKHMMVTNVRGSMGKLSGTIQYDPANLAASTVKASVDVLGLNTNEPKRDAHLKSPDFFDTDKWSKIEFVSTKWWKEGDKVKIAGNLTMHGVTKPVTLDAEISPQVGNKIGAVASTKINRKDWGLTWNRAVEAGGVAVSDEVGITLDIEANAQK